MVVLIAVAVVALVGAGVGWALARFARELARYDEWDQPIAARKRKSWK